VNHESTIPPGWRQNPSTWARRVPLFGLALLGLAIALYLALYQLDIFSTIWEPFFDQGSREVLHSGLSQILPIPDAALGALAYLLEAVAELLGGSDRWRNAPWAVFAFSVITGVMVAASALLVIWQGAVVKNWCTLCLCSAAISFLITALAIDEWRAAWQHVRANEQKGISFWSALTGKARA
jgi:uncharacterized membrane protein